MDTRRAGKQGKEGAIIWPSPPRRDFAPSIRRTTLGDEIEIGTLGGGTALATLHGSQLAGCMHACKHARTGRRIAASSSQNRQSQQQTPIMTSAD
jgi:hypothetical protein